MKARLAGKGMEAALGDLQALSGDLPQRALVDVLNHTAYQARQALHAEMASVFDNPTPWTLKSVKVFEAKPEPEPAAALWIDDYRASKDIAPDRWLKAEVFGGAREDKGLERLLRAKGILPAGLFVVPGSGARLDRYGSLSMGQIAQLKSGLMIADRGGYTGNASRSKRSAAKGNAQAFFVMRRGKTPIGIAERRGEQVRVVLAFVRQPTYASRLDFHGVVRRVAEERIPGNVDRAIVKALDGTLGVRTFGRANRGRAYFL